VTSGNVLVAKESRRQESIRGGLDFRRIVSIEFGSIYIDYTCTCLAF